MSLQKFSIYQREALLRVYKCRCCICGNIITSGQFHIDHIIPETFKDSSKFEKIKTDLSLGLDFEINGYENLCIACPKCNIKKSDALLHLPILSMLISDAKSKSNRIKELATKLKNESSLSFLLAKLKNHVEHNGVSTEEIFSFINDELRSGIHYKLSSFVKEFSWIEDNSISPEIITQLLTQYIDETLEWELPNETKTISTLRDYIIAENEGYFPHSNAAMSLCHWHFELPLAVIAALKFGKIPHQSTISTPHIGIENISLLHSSTAFDITENDEPSSSPERTIYDLVQNGTARIIDCGSGFIKFEYNECITYIFEILRCNISGDGYQEILAHYGGGAKYGTLAIGDIWVFSKKDHDSVFSTKRLWDIVDKKSILSE